MKFECTLNGGPFDRHVTEIDAVTQPSMIVMESETFDLDDPGFYKRNKPKQYRLNEYTGLYDFVGEIG